MKEPERMLKKTLISALQFSFFLLLLALAGCGKQAPAAAQPSAGQQPQLANTIDACTLLTKADAEQVLGSPVDEALRPVQSTEPNIVDSCEYRITGATAKDHVVLTVVLPVSGDLESAQKIFAAGRQGAQATYGSTLPDVPGLGDSAYWVGGEGNTLMMMKGSMTVSLSVSTQKGDIPSQAMLDLGKLVLGRLH
jgi:hypothetical protein